MRLPKYLEHKVKMGEIFKRPVDLETKKGILEMFEQMKCDLSPENLSCDGELSATETNRQFRQIQTAWRYLEKKLGREVSQEY